jgi:hypothetical protein
MPLGANYREGDLTMAKKTLKKSKKATKPLMKVNV